MDKPSVLSFLAIMGVAIIFLWNTFILGDNYKVKAFYCVYIFMLTVLYCLTLAICVVLW